MEERSAPWHAADSGPSAGLAPLGAYALPDSSPKPVQSEHLLAAVWSASAHRDVGPTRA